MSSNPRYQATEEDDASKPDETPSSSPPPIMTPPPLPVITTAPAPAVSIPIIAADQSPPPYIADVDTSNVEFSNEPPPQYSDVVKLPTYTESENINENQHEMQTDEEENTNRRSIFFYWLNNDAYNQLDSSQAIGNDASFMFSFLLSLIFNWIGFLISYCFTNNLASYYGAISGFGISLVKWAFIAKNSEWSRVFMKENPWFCYAFVLFGWVIFMRGIFAYIQLKRLANNHPNYADRNTCAFFG